MEYQTDAYLFSCITASCNAAKNKADISKDSVY